VSEPKRTPDGFVIAFPPLEGDFPFERDPVIEHFKRFVDRDAIRENLKLTPDERLRKLVALQRNSIKSPVASRAGSGRLNSVRTELLQRLLEVLRFERL
jgi:hypothetical protein